MTAVAARIGEIRAMVQPVPSAAGSASIRRTTPAAPSAAQVATGSSFANALARATVPGIGTATPVAQSGATAIASVAALHAGHRNGRVPADALAPIGHGSHRLAAPAAAAFTALQAAAQRDGISFGITDSYRSYDAQVDVARRKGLYAQGGLAAQPGTSQHGWGLAVDLDLDARAQSWMRANGARFGFVEDTPREPWHWAYTA